MSKIDDLIAELCPEGVGSKTLGECLEVVGGFSFPSAGFNTEGSGLRVIRIGDVNSDRSRTYWLGDYPRSCYVRDGDLLMSLSGDINITSWNAGPALLNQRVAKLVPVAEIVLSRYIFHLLKLKLSDLTAGTSKSVVANLSIATLKSFPIPVPPLEVQREIVSILDKFAQLEAELEAELEARRIEYEATRDGLLDFGGNLAGHALEQKILNLCPSGIESLKLRQLGELFSGLSGKSKGDFSDGNSPFVSYLDIGNNSSLPREIRTKVKVGPQERQNEVRKGDLLFTGSSEDREGVGLTSEVEYSPSESTYLNSFCFGFRPKKGAFETGYLKHLLRSTTMRNKVKACSNGVTRINISKKNLVKVDIPVPPIEVQAYIVSILDKLDALVNDITIGLPAEIAARRKQYQYYRNKLLTFKELESA